MATEHNRRFAVAQRRYKVTELYLKKWSQAAIAAELNVSQSTVSEDVQFVRRKWEQSADRNFDELRTRELQTLDYIEREAWAAWERSQKPAQSAVVSGEGPAQQTRKSMKHQIGDPRFLDQVNKCIAQRRAITGIDLAPVPPASENQFDGNVTLEVRQQRVDTLIQAYLARQRLGDVGTRVDDGQPRNVCGGNEPGAVDDGPAPDAAGPSHPGDVDGQPGD